MKVLQGPCRLVLTMLHEEPDQGLLAEIASLGLVFAGAIPDDPELRAFDRAGRPTSLLPPENPARKAAFALFARLLAEIQAA